MKPPHPSDDTEAAKMLHFVKRTLYKRESTVKATAYTTLL